MSYIFRRTGGSGAPSFGTIQVPNGTNPTAVIEGDTVDFISSDGSVTMTGNSATNELDFQITAGYGGIYDESSWASPTTITTAIAAPTRNRTRRFVVGSGAVVDPNLGNGADANEFHLVGTSNTNTVELNSTTNLLLSGAIVLKLGSYLLLHWVSGLNKWVEVSRNEI